jgi:16S rRNA (guanine527-N7)-methyltransferase
VPVYARCGEPRTKQNDKSILVKPGHSPGEALAALAAEWSVPCGPTEQAALMRYCELLLTWSARINLTGARTLEALLVSHLPDAFALASVLSGNEHVVDIGSGGGLPGIPLAVLRPGLRVLLVEPIAKKVAFLRTAVRELGLGLVSVDPHRSEDLVRQRAQFDAAVSRATLPPQAWVSLGLELLRPGGRVFVLAAADVPVVGPPGAATLVDRLYLGGARRLLVLQAR